MSVQQCGGYSAMWRDFISNQEGYLSVVLMTYAVILGDIIKTV